MLRPAEHILGLKRQTLDRQDVLFAEAEFGRSLPVAVADEARFGRRRHRHVPLEDLLRDRLAPVESGDRGEQLVSADVLAFEHPAAAQHVAVLRRTGAVEASAELVEFLEDGDVVAGNIAVANHEGGRGQRGDPAADEIDLGRAPIDAIAPHVERIGDAIWTQHYETPYVTDLRLTSRLTASTGSENSRNEQSSTDTDERSAQP